MLGSLILYLKGMRIMMFQLSGLYCTYPDPEWYPLVPIGPKVAPFWGFMFRIL